MSGHVLREQLVLPSDRIIVAYDGMDWPEIINTASEIGQFTGMGKTNSKHVRSGANHAVWALSENGQRTMLDSKFNDIPGTVEDSLYEATLAGASLVTVHASGGVEMMRGAVKGRDRAREWFLKDDSNYNTSMVGNVLGITVLTSLGDEAYSIFGLDRDDKDAIRKKVVEFAHMAVDAGLDGIVCSPLETEAIRSHGEFNGLLVVNPGITPIFANTAADQKRTTNAKQAIEAGADFVVIGRGLNKAADYGMTKKEAAVAVGEEIKEGLPS